MTIRLNARITTACLATLLTLAPATAALAQQKEQPAQSEKTPAAEPAAPAPAQGSLITPAGSAAEAPAAAPAPEQVPPAETPAAAAPAAARSDMTDYTIKQGDTLWDISNAFYRDPFLWPLIWQANPSITNPDLIFAGNKLTVPDVTAVERAMAAPQPAAVEKEAPAPAAAAPQPAAEQAVAPEPAPEPKSLAGIASARATRPKPARTEAAAAEEETPTGSTLILPEEQPQTLIDKYTMLSAGFINSVESTDKIVEPVEIGKTELAYDDFVYIKIASRDAVNIGDKFLVYRPLEIVVHPLTHEKYGRLIRGLGVVQITAKDPSSEFVTGRITLSFDTIEPGAPLVPYQEPALLYPSSEKKAKDITGYVLETQDTRTLNGQTDVVYLDKGIQDGVDPGDRFTVYAVRDRKDLPRKVIGEVLVFLVKDRTATAVVRKSTETMAPGNAFSFKP